MHYFDSRDMKLTPNHIMASGALPPAFPAVRIDGELYWDGGILSNTPTERIFEDNPRRNSLIFAVHLVAPDGIEPETIWQILHRAKDIQYSSRIASHIVRQRETHRLRHVITHLLRLRARGGQEGSARQELAGYRCHTRMHVVRLLAPRLDNESLHQGHRLLAGGHPQRWEAGLCRHHAALTNQAWIGEWDPLDGVILHEPQPGAEPAAEMNMGEAVTAPPGPGSHKLAAE